MNRPRSYLFVPGDAERKMDKALAAGADAVIVDLEDSVAPDRKDEALELTRAWLSGLETGQTAPQLWVRVNAEAPERALEELSRLPLAPIAGIVHPKLDHHDQLERMGHWLDALEARDGIARQTTGILGIITETAAAVVGEGRATLARGHPRLRGYAWGVEDLSADIGRPPLTGTTRASAVIAETVQLHCLLMATAAGVQAIDGISTVLRDPDALAAECAYGRELGFSGKLAIHPAQLESLHDGLAPSEQAREWARRVCELADQNPRGSSFQLDGRMIDRPHIRVARDIMRRID